jgi:dTDP-4-amino-4,6-dideoxygalactose transaminase
VIEDCAHGFGGNYKGKPNGTVAEAAFYSTQWNKPFSTGLGGIAVTRHQAVAEQLRDAERSYMSPSFLEVALLRALYVIRTYLLTSRTYWAAITLYRWLSKHNLILGSSQGEELEYPKKPWAFEKKLSDFQAKTGIGQLITFTKTLQHRRKIAAEYDAFLRTAGVEPPVAPSYADHAYLKYPVLVKKRETLFKKAIDAKIELGDWFLSPIHPIDRNFENWHYRWGENPVGEKISQQVINLPTHTDVDVKYMHRIQTFLRHNRDSIFSSVEECLKFN